MSDVTEFLASIELNRDMGEVNATVTYQDSCHLAHGQQVRAAPRKLLQAIPGIDSARNARGRCSAAAARAFTTSRKTRCRCVRSKPRWQAVNATGAELVATANPGCMLQLQAGVRAYGKSQRVMHVVELLDQAYAAGSDPAPKL